MLYQFHCFNHVVLIVKSVVTWSQEARQSNQQPLQVLLPELISQSLGGWSETNGLASRVAGFWLYNATFCEERASSKLTSGKPPGLNHQPQSHHSRFLMICQ